LSSAIADGTILAYAPENLDTAALMPIHAPVRILVVEHNPGTGGMTASLAVNGYSVQAVEAKAAALDKAAGFVADVAYVDLDALDAAVLGPWIAKWSRRFGSPVVVASADDRPEAVRDAFNLGAAEYVDKEADADATLPAAIAAIRNAFARAQAQAGTPAAPAHQASDKPAAPACGEVFRLVFRQASARFADLRPLLQAAGDPTSADILRDLDELDALFEEARTLAILGAGQTPRPGFAPARIIAQISRQSDEGRPLRVEGELPDSIRGDARSFTLLVHRLRRLSALLPDSPELILRTEEDPQGEASALVFSLRTTAGPEALDASESNENLPVRLCLEIIRFIAALCGGETAVKIGKNGLGVLRVVTFEHVESASPKPTPRPAPSREERILLAEDNEINMTFLLEFLRSAGFDVVPTRDGEQALQAAKEGHFDLAVLDIQMPRLDGLSVMKAIRAGECPGCAPDMPVLALTAYAIKGEREKHLAEGMSDHLSKPIRREVLLETIERLLGTTRSASPSRAEAGEPSSTPAEPPDRQAATLLSDETAFRHLGDNPALVEKLRSVFARDLPRKSEQLEAARDAMRLDQLRDLAHSLRSSLRAVGSEEGGLISQRLLEAAQSEDKPAASRHSRELLALLRDLAVALD
jgi:CheY-like chemotaxis protein/HPt (histidine-containing phosphotransfer) domain-containing protein